VPLARTTPFSYPRATVAAVARVLADLESAQLRRRQGTGARPFVTLSWAQSLDGCLALEAGRPTALSGEESLALTHALRAAHDGIVIGVGTLLADDPALTVRFWPGASPAPVVLDSSLRTSLQSRLVAAAGARPVAFACTTAGDVDRQARLEARGAKVVRLPACDSGWVDLAALLDHLGAAGVKRVMVEGGAKVLTSFLQAQLADYAIVTIAPRFLGGLAAVGPLAGSARPQITGPSFERFGTDMVMAGPLHPAPVGHATAAPQAESQI
jgi:GTP cyclohydrolase II